MKESTLVRFKKKFPKVNNIISLERRVFTVKYYRGVLGEGKAKKVKDYTRDELIPLLIVREERGTY